MANNNNASVSLADEGAPTPLSNATLFGFSLGMIGERIFRDAPALLLMIYMTNYLAIPPLLAGAAIFIPKTLIMFIDPTVGTISDRLKTPWGKRRPMMFVGAFLTGLSLIIFFHVPRFPDATQQAAYMCGMILLGFTGYSLFSVPYLTMGSEIASSNDERRKVMSWRIVFMAVGLSLSAFSPGLVQHLGGGLNGYTIMSMIFGTICLVTMLTSVFSTGGIRPKINDAKQLSLLQQFRVVAANGRYLRLLLVCFAQKLGEGVGYTTFTYFCIYVVHQKLDAILLVVVSSVVGQVISQPFWLWASRRWSGRSLYTLGALGWCVNLLLWLAMKDQSPYWLIPLGLQGGFAAGGFLTVTMGMLANTMAADAAKTGVNREGVYSGFWLATEKLAVALGALVVGEMLREFGFVESAAGLNAHQTDFAILGIGVTYCGVNILVYLASILAVRRITED